MTSQEPAPDGPNIQITVSRGRALERGLLRIIPAGLMLAVSVGTVSSLNFASNPFTNRITEYCLALVMVPVGLGGAVLAFSGARWLLTAFWPGRLCIVADAGGITFHLGPMGTVRCEVDRITLRYPFELNTEDDGENAVFESFLEPSEQMATLLPRMEYAGEPKRLDRRILHFTRLDEAQAAELLRPFVEFVRS